MAEIIQLYTNRTIYILTSWTGHPRQYLPVGYMANQLAVFIEHRAQHPNKTRHPEFMMSLISPTKSFHLAILIDPIIKSSTGKRRKKRPKRFHMNRASILMNRINLPNLRFQCHFHSRFGFWLGKGSLTEHSLRKLSHAVLFASRLVSEICRLGTRIPCTLASILAGRFFEAQGGPRAQL